MYKLYIPWLFLAIIMANSLKIAGTIGYYAIFTEDFVERYCVNKATPELNCDGQCELAKMLMQEHNSDDLPINVALLTTDVILFLPFETNIDFISYHDTVLPDKHYLDLYSFNFVDQRIHPPRA